MCIYVSRDHVGRSQSKTLVNGKSLVSKTTLMSPAEKQTSQVPLSFLFLHSLPSVSWWWCSKKTNPEKLAWSRYTYDEACLYYLVFFIVSHCSLVMYEYHMKVSPIHLVQFLYRGASCSMLKSLNMNHLLSIFGEQSNSPNRFVLWPKVFPVLPKTS